MKALLILLLLASPIAAKPVRQGGMVCRTIQEDAELKDWIQGVQKQLQLAQASEKEAKTGREVVRQELQSTRTNLGAAQQSVTTLQGQIAAVQAEADKVPGLKVSLAKAQKHVWQLVALSGVLGIGCLVLGYLLLKP